jgi:hypothetical protein
MTVSLDKTPTVPADRPWWRGQPTPRAAVPGRTPTRQQDALDLAVDNLRAVIAETVPTSTIDYRTEALLYAIGVFQRTTAERPVCTADYRRP